MQRVSFNESREEMKKNRGEYCDEAIYYKGDVVHYDQEEFTCPVDGLRGIHPSIWPKVFVEKKEEQEKKSVTDIGYKTVKIEIDSFPFILLLIIVLLIILLK